MTFSFRDLETECRSRAQKAADRINKFLCSVGVQSEEPLLVFYQGTGWKVFNAFEGEPRIPLKKIDPEFGCLPEVKDHPNELVYVKDFADTGRGAIVLRGRPHLYQKWFNRLTDGTLLEVSAKYLVRLHTEMMLYLGLVREGRVGPYIITSATGSLDADIAPPGSVMVVRGYNSYGLDLPIQRFTVARGALCLALQLMALSSGKGLEVCLDGENKTKLNVFSGGLKVILGPAFEDPEFEKIKDGKCQAVGMSGPTACHVIRGFNEKLAQHAEASRKDLVRAVHLALVTDDPYKRELIHESPFEPDSCWESTHEAVLRLAGLMQDANRQLIINLAQFICSEERFD